VGLHGDPALDRAVRELAVVERALQVAGDEKWLARFGVPESGYAIAEACGYTLLTTREATMVDRLRWLPDSFRLIKAYLEANHVPRTTALKDSPADPPTPAEDVDPDRATPPDPATAHSSRSSSPTRAGSTRLT
jgi:hypothetical protein